MKYLSVCSGIEAATLAWRPLGWEAAAFSEIEPFPCAVLKHYYHEVKNLGDMTKFKEWPDEAVDLLVGGTPCQSFSVAGLRKGLDDPRGNLMLTYGVVAKRYQPWWIVWENVPGVLSSHKGRDFGTFLGMLAELGYGFAYRVLDAQWFGVAQRRRRVFVVGYLGDWRRAAAVLFESESLRGDPAPSREKGKEVAPTLSRRSKSRGYGDEGMNGGLVAATETGAGFWSEGLPRLRCSSAPSQPQTIVARPLCAHPGGFRLDLESETFVTHALRADGFDASEDGTGRGTPLISVAFDCKAGANTGFAIGEKPGSLRGAGHGGGHAAVVFESRFVRNGRGGPSDIVPPLKAQSGKTGKGDAAPLVAGTLRGHTRPGSNSLSGTVGVRRLTPRECERLQGLPDNYTRIPYRKNKKTAKDGPRYKAIGNAFAVPCLAWLGRRIEMVQLLRPAGPRK